MLAEIFVLRLEAIFQATVHEPTKSLTTYPRFVPIATFTSVATALK